MRSFAFPVFASGCMWCAGVASVIQRIPYVWLCVCVGIPCVCVTLVCVTLVCVTFVCVILVYLSVCYTVYVVVCYTVYLVVCYSCVLYLCVLLCVILVYFSYMCYTRGLYCVFICVL